MSKSTYALVLSLYGNFIIGQPTVVAAAKACMALDNVANRRALLEEIYRMHSRLVGSSLSPCLIPDGPSGLMVYTEVLDEMFGAFIRDGDVGSLNAIATFTLSSLDARMELDTEECEAINEEYAARRKASAPKVVETLLVDHNGNNLGEDPSKLIIRG